MSLWIGEVRRGVRRAVISVKAKPSSRSLDLNVSQEQINDFCEADGTGDGRALVEMGDDVIEGTSLDGRSKILCVSQVN